jgi:methyl-accepting chemotaxis protein
MFAAVPIIADGQTAVDRYPDYRGMQVISAYGPIEVAGLRWAIAAKQDVAEALAPAIQLKRELLVAAAVATIALTFLALACAGLFMRPHLSPCQDLHFQIRDRNWIT